MRRARNVWDKKRGIWQPRISEEHVLREIVTRLWLQARIRVVRINQPVNGLTPQNEPGIPDLIGWISTRSAPEVLGAMPLFIEVKRPGGAHRLAQELFISDAKAGGCIAFFAESWQDCVDELAKFGLKLKGD